MILLLAGIVRLLGKRNGLYRYRGHLTEYVNMYLFFYFVFELPILTGLGQAGRAFTFLVAKK